MKRGLNAHYRQIAEEFALQIIAELREHIHSVVLFGSVARKQARHESDIDLLVIGDDASLWDATFDVTYATMTRRDFDVYVESVYISFAEFDRGAKYEMPFIMNVLTEGIILHDDGTFAREREGVLSVSRPHSRGRESAS